MVALINKTKNIKITELRKNKIHTHTHIHTLLTHGNLHSVRLRGGTLNTVLEIFIFKKFNPRGKQKT